MAKETQVLDSVQAYTRQAEDAAEKELGELVERVRACHPHTEAVCRRLWSSPTGLDFYDVGSYVKGSTYFVPLTPMWGTRNAAWVDAVKRLGI